MNLLQILLVFTIFMVGGDRGKSAKRGRSKLNPGPSSSSGSGNYRSPCDPNNGRIGSSGSFRTEAILNFYYKVFSRCAIICERSVEIIDFEGNLIERVLEKYQWQALCELNEAPNENICREFYANLDIVHKSANCLHCFVRGVFFDITPATIAQFLGCPIVRNPNFPYSEVFPRPSYDVVASLLTGAARTWNGVAAMLRHAQLTPEFAILHFFVCGNVCPVQRHTEVQKDRALLMFAMANDVSIDLGSFIFSVILNSFENPSIRNALPFGSLITSLCFKAGVNPFDDDVYGSLGPVLNANILARRGGQLNRGNRAPPVAAEVNQQVPQDNYSMRDIMEAIHGVKTDVGNLHTLVDSQIELSNAQSSHLQNLDKSVAGIQDELLYYRQFFMPREGDPRGDGTSGSGGFS